jgi:hypothetical protein
MNSLRSKLALAVLLGMAGFAYSNKGGSADPVKISRTVANDGTFVTLEWNSSPQRLYAVETSTDMKTWSVIEEDLSDPLAPRAFVYQIPDEYVFDSRRFFRVVTTTR